MESSREAAFSLWPMADQDGGGQNVSIC